MGNPYDTQTGPNGSPIGFDNRFTLRTNERTDELTNTVQDQGSHRLVPDAPTPVDKRVHKSSAIDLAATRRILADVAAMHDARGAALEASGLTDFHARWVWLQQHPITEWLDPTPLEVLAHELDAARAGGFRTNFASRSVPKPKRRYQMSEFTETQLRIAAEVAERRHSA